MQLMHRQVVCSSQCDITGRMGTCAALFQPANGSERYHCTMDGLVISLLCTWVYIAVILEKGKLTAVEMYICI